MTVKAINIFMLKWSGNGPHYPCALPPRNQAGRYNHKTITTIKKIKAGAINRSTASTYSKHYLARDKNRISIPHSDLVAT
jgi:hypothetical protein